MMIDQPFTIAAMFIPAKPSGGDPLGQRGYLAVKFSGGFHQQVNDDNTVTARAELRDTIIKQLDHAIESAIRQPDTTVSQGPMK